MTSPLYASPPPTPNVFRNKPEMPPKRKSAPPPSTPSKKPAPTPPSPSPLWPNHFVSLARTHRAVNTIFTFLSARNIATTFAALQPAVEAQTRKPLTPADIAQLKLLLPSKLRFEYVPADEQDVYADASQEVLLLEFLEAGKKKGREGKPPTAAQMKKTIEARNAEFSAAVREFLGTHGEGAVEQIEQLSQRFIPAPTPAEPPPFEIPTERKPMAEIISELEREDLSGGTVVPAGHRVTPAQPAKYGGLTFLLSQSLVNALYNARGITQLYAHQAQAISHIHDGEDVIVSTATSSGKSLIYQIPVLHELERNGQATALFIFPTKALAQDQKRSLNELLGYMTESLEEVLVDTFDGDTEKEERRRIREEASVILTNPDTLHLNILPNSRLWRRFLQNLKFLVVDGTFPHSSPSSRRTPLTTIRAPRLHAHLRHPHRLHPPSPSPPSPLPPLPTVLHHLLRHHIFTHSSHARALRAPRRLPNIYRLLPVRFQTLSPPLLPIPTHHRRQVIHPPRPPRRAHNCLHSGPINVRAPPRLHSARALPPPPCRS